MVHVYGEDDKKMKGFLKSVGYPMYRACDEHTRDRIEQAKTNEVIHLKGDDFK